MMWHTYVSFHAVELFAGQPNSRATVSKISTLRSCPPARPQVHAMIELAIEQCMNRTQCIAALQKNGIDATVTGIVWERLEQENPEFFELYATVERERLNNSNGMSRCSSSCSLSTVAAQDTNNRSPFASPRVTGLAGGFGLCL